MQVVHPPWLVVFDFDRSLLDWTDTDLFIFEEIAPHMLTRLKSYWNEKKFTNWNRLVDHMLGELHSQGISQEKITQTFERCLLTSDAVGCLQYLREKECYISIVSDSNTVYIETVLRASKARDFVHHIATNPAEFAPNGRLFLSPYQTEPHFCSGCPENMCKVDKLRERKRTIYVGDGHNDFCACKRLTDNDYIFAKRDSTLHKSLLETATVATIMLWTDSAEFFKLFKELLG